MIRPSKITLFDREIGVVYCDNVMDVNPSGEEIWWGAYNDGERMIRIYTGLSDIDFIHTFLHECMHAISHLLHLDLSEKDVDLVSFGLADLVNNGEYIALALDKRKK